MSMDNLTHPTDQDLGPGLLVEPATAAVIDTASERNLDAVVEQPDTSLASERIGSLLSSEVATVNSFHLRRSARTTKYDGFKIPIITDIGKLQSKVKPKQPPSITSRSITTRSSAGLRVAVGNADEPPHRTHPSAPSSALDPRCAGSLWTISALRSSCRSMTSRPLQLKPYVIE